MNNFKSVLINSTFVKIIIFLLRPALLFGKNIYVIYLNSKVYSIAISFLNFLRISFRNSYSYEIIVGPGIDFLGNSFFSKKLAGSYATLKVKLSNMVENTFLNDVKQALSEGLKYSPLKVCGTFILICIVINILFSFISHQQISTIGWITRTLLLVTGFIFFIIRIDLATLKKGSYAIKLLGKNDA